MAGSFGSESSYQKYVTDLNGDGKADIVIVYSGGGGFWAYKSVGMGDGGFSPATGGRLLGGSFGSETAYQKFAEDIDGDGKFDVAIVYTGSAGFYAYSAMNTKGISNLLTSLNSGLSATNSITYKALTEAGVHSRDSNATYPYLDFQGPLYVVSQTQSSDGLGGNYTTNYTYAGAKLHLTGGGFLGFMQLAASDPQTGITTTTTYSQNYPYQGLPKTVEKRTRWGVLLNSVENTWQNTAISKTYHRNDLIQTVEQSWELNGIGVPRTKTNTSFDAYGNPTQITVATDESYNYNSFNANGPVNPYGNVKTTTNIYSNDTTNWFLGRLTRATVTSTLPTGATATRTSAFAYDAASGLLTQEVIEPDNAALKLTTAYTLDAFGNRVATTVSGADIATRTSTTTFDAQGRFPVKGTNALGHSETRTFDPGFGNPLSLTGPNGLTTTWAYDGFGRKTKETRADGTQSNFAFAFCANNCPTNAVYYTTATATGAPSTTVYFDSLNREIRRGTQGFDGRISTVDKLYDAWGRVAQVSKPYFPGETVAWSKFTYDILGRTVKVTEADGGVTQSSYNGLTVSVTNPLGRTTNQTKNGLGQVVKTVDAQGNTLSFAFDAFGNPIKTVDAKGNAITLGYDLRGRKTRMTDPDMGNWTYAYDVLGQMLRQIDAKGQTTTLSYDKLGRVVQRVEPGLTSTWVWDTAAKGIGKLASETSSNGWSRAYVYDTLGRLSQTNTTITGLGTYNQTTVYDGYGRVSKLIQPSGFAALNLYNSYGYVAEVQDAASGKSFWQAQNVDASGRIISEKLGNNLLTTRAFNAMGRPTYISTGKFGVTPDVQNLTLDHDQNGNLTSRSDAATGRSDMFSYDELDRLTTDFGPGGKILSYQYDSIGNITFKTDVGSYTYGTKPHAVAQISGGY
ncbi:MAG: toxin TcdB middle/N-terminal domain-containing protein, partial [Candidatus Methylumidiphilus sp.]